MAGGADSAHAQTFNPSLAVAADDPSPGVPSDVVANFDLPDGDVNFAAVVSFIPKDWGVVPGDQIPIGMQTGLLDAQSVLGLANGSCSTQLPVQFDMLNASINTEDLVPFEDEDENNTADFADDDDGNGIFDGIDKYPEASGFAALKGARNDMERARAVLEQRFGFASAGIVELTDERATHENIVRAIKTHLIDKAGPDTHVVLWFSGHGSRVPDASGNDSSPIEFSEAVSDETFVAWDSRLDGKSGNYDISDDELFSLLAAIPSKSVVMVADCCHSSGLLRGGPRAGVREAPMGTLPVDSKLTKDFWPSGLEWRDDDNWRETVPNLVFVAACVVAQQHAVRFIAARRR